MSEGRHSYQHPFTSYFRDSLPGYLVPGFGLPGTTQMGKWKDALWDDTGNFTDGVALVLEPGEALILWGINIYKYINMIVKDLISKKYDVFVLPECSFPSNRGQRLPSVAAQVGFVARQRGTEGGYPEGGCGQFVEQHHRRDLDICLRLLKKIVYICWV